MGAAKAWNGGSIESAMEYARKLRDKAVEQGATLCGECGGEGGTIHGVCIGCHGQGVIVPPGGLRLNDAAPTPLCDCIEQATNGYWFNTRVCDDDECSDRADAWCAEQNAAIRALQGGDGNV